MATQTVLLPAFAALSNTIMKLTDLETDAIVQSVSSSEVTLGGGIYSGAFIDAPAATYRVKLYDEDGEVAWTASVVLTLATATFHTTDGFIIGIFPANVVQINGDATAAANLALSAAAICTGTTDTGCTTTSIVTSVLSPAVSVVTANQLVGRIVIFNRNTTTIALRGQATNITDSSSSVPTTLTVTALTVEPGATDTFIIV